ncbi:hypothetical protein PsorP6_018146 [Peronosclerospora sorghi]|uniref:Uncharacterized protein n=1 Tax=Peronosclerospora sorghi TaxID=230839 RepID=A0ACC0WF49_9STRA|nr:hypothetical protein PsorP6_018146 [Peronosclerospora sorghi]
MDDTEDAEIDEGIEGIQEAQRIADMAANRTADFAQLCQHYASFKRSAPHQKPAHTPLQENLQFNAAVSDISKEVYQASKRLQQLTQRCPDPGIVSTLARNVTRTARFVFPPFTCRLGSSVTN